MAVRSEPCGFQNSPPSSRFPAVQSMQSAYFSGDDESPPSHELTANAGEPAKPKRGRPRKYAAAPDGPMALPDSGLSQTPTTTKKKARPRDVGKKRQMNALGSSGIGFTPHIIAVKAGEDVSAKIMSFSNSSPRSICVLSANGAISTAQVCRPGDSGGTSTYEGRYEILSLSGSILPAECSADRIGGLTVSLAGPDGHVLGGGVAGLLIAATPVQVIVGSFISGSRRKERQPASLSVIEPAPEKLTENVMLGFRSPNSGGFMSESSGGGHMNPYNHHHSSNGHDHHRDGNGDQAYQVTQWN